ncbi:hypothetical protein B9Z19DRAFT_1061242 [Tuber borchii]|uniref:WD40-repeat-containing domain protein n=1 Tax=Tuber borchii TaxID=42251 RepID=A0A2T7A5Z4_TUBBO|nr:hypothetical protein B9Z19DRAFT_1061242 [Tuber borchii]
MPPRAFHQTSTSNLSTPEGTYIYTLTSLSATHLAASTSASSSSSSSLITFSKSTLAPTTTIPHAHINITSLNAYPASPQTLLTSGTDGLVKLWDLRCSPPAALASEINVGAPVLCASANAQGGIIAGTEMRDHVSRVCVWDGRVVGEKPTWVFTESHGDDVSFVGFAGGEEGRRWGVSGGMDGLVNVFDLLAGKGAGGEDDEKALWQVVNVGASVHRAGFLNAGSGGTAAAGKGEWAFGISTDESLVLRSFNHTPGGGGEQEDAEGEVAGNVGDVRGRLDCEYVVDVLRASSTGAGGIVVAGNKEVGKQRIDLVPLRWTGGGGQWGFASEDKVRLQGGHGEEVCRGVWVDEEVGLLSFFLSCPGL